MNMFLYNFFFYYISTSLIDWLIAVVVVIDVSNHKFDFCSTLSLSRSFSGFFFLFWSEDQICYFVIIFTVTVVNLINIYNISIDDIFHCVCVCINDKVVCNIFTFFFWFPLFLCVCVCVSVFIYLMIITYIFIIFSSSSSSTTTTTATTERKWMNVVV
mgnify:CR=1 FL=1